MKWYQGQSHPINPSQVESATHYKKQGVTEKPNE